MPVQVAPSKILAIKLRALGDTVILTAALSELKSAFPSAQIHVVAPEAWAPLLENHPAVDKLFPYRKPERIIDRGRQMMELAFKLRRERYDWVLNFHASPSSALLVRGLGGAPAVRAVHFHSLKEKNHFSTIEIPGKGQVKPTIERDMDVLRGAGMEIAEGKLPQLHPTIAETEAATKWLAERKLPEPLLVIGLGASRPTKQWPIDRFAAVAGQWSVKTGGSALAICAPNEQELAARFKAALGAGSERVAVETGFSLRALIGLLSKSKAFVGNDSGPKHMAVAVGIPTVTLFGPEDPFEWHPYPRDRHPILFTPDLPCRPVPKDAPAGTPPWCGLAECVVEKHQCMERIPVESVMAECEKFLK